MIVFLTTAAFAKPLSSLTGSGFGCNLPEVRVESYEAVLRQPRLPRASYVFADLERLSSFELRIAGSLAVALSAAGLRVLNNPTRVKLRYELLREMARRNLNPFTVYRADDHPQPARFPVFLRTESGHLFPLSPLLHNQAELDAALDMLRRSGQPNHGVLVVECCPSDRFEDRWHKWGAFCVAGEAVLDHIAVDDRWMVKLGRWEQLTPGIVALENRAVLENRFADYVRDVFAIAGIDFGRADFALADGRLVLFEINTNPIIYDLTPDPHALRCETRDFARQKLAAALFRIDSQETGEVDVPADKDKVLTYCRSTRQGTMLAPRL